MATLLGLDYGQKHLGVALALGPLAEPLQLLPTASAFPQIQLIHQYQVDAIVIGLSEGQMAHTTHRFGQELQQATGLPVYYQDETLSSQETRLKLAQSGQKKSIREGKIDHLVAAAILQDYLDSLASQA